MDSDSGQSTGRIGRGERMKYSYPVDFLDFDSWVEYSENLRRRWEASRFWEKYSPEDWIREFPDMEERVTELYLESENRLIELKEEFKRVEESFSTDLNTRIFQECLLDSTVGIRISSLDKKIKEYRCMLGSLRPKEGSDNGSITDEDIDKARNYPIVDLLDNIPKRGFIRCPFHTEKTPSCKVFSDHLYCFGCGKYLNPIDYVMETQGKSFINSVKYLCQK